MKYYDNMPLVMEIQSRLKEWKEQDQRRVGATPQSQERSAGRQRARTRQEVKKK